VSPRGRPDPGSREHLLSFGEGQYSQSLEIGLAILRIFSPEQPVMGIADMADAIGFSRGTTHRYVVTLVACGFMEQLPSRKYRLGKRVADIGMSALGATGLPDSALVHLADLRDRVGYTVSLAILDGSEIVYVARACSHRRGQYKTDIGRRIGSRIPASCTAMGKVLVAGLPAVDERKWTRATKLTPAGPKAIIEKTAFRAELERVRELGFAVNNRELMAGMVAVAAPVHNRETVSAAIGIAANAKLISANKLATTCREELLATASEISRHVDYNPQTRWRST
jgi:IclR family transcriptional regulator, pca regulon regulatory protein